MVSKPLLLPPTHPSRSRWKTWGWSSALFKQEGRENLCVQVCLEMRWKTFIFEVVYRQQFVRGTHTQSSFQHGIFFLSSLIILAESRCMELQCEREGKASERATVFRTRSSSTPWRFSLSFSFAKNMTCHISSASISPLPLIECGPEQDEIICACAWNKPGPFTNTHCPSFVHPVGLLISLISVGHT